MSDYVPIDWVDNVTPVDAARMDHIEGGIDQAAIDAAAAQATANAAIAKAIVDAKGDLIVATAADIVARLAVGSNGQVLMADSTTGPGVKWAAVSGGGGSAVDYKGAWAVGTAYIAGDVVLYNGVEYICVNASTGNTPPSPSQVAVPVSLVTAFPTTPFDGQTVDFTDSLTTPTYVWRFRYVAASGSNKWKFVGGAPLTVGPLGYDTTTSLTFVDLATVGPSITVPLAGTYLVQFDAEMGSNTINSGGRVALKEGATAATDAQALQHIAGVVNQPFHFSTQYRITCTAGEVLKLQYRVNVGGTCYFINRLLSVQPVAVG